jgi:hypothetical protein
MTPGLLLRRYATCDDEHALSCQAAVYADDVVARTDVSGFVDGAHAGADGPSERWSGGGRWAGVPPFGRCLPCEGVVGTVVVVMASPAVELALQFL